MENKDAQEISNRLKAMQANMDRISRNLYFISYIVVGAGLVYVGKDIEKSEYLSFLPDWLISTVGFIAIVFIPGVFLRKI